jgi:hypothetical protein
MYDIGFAWLDVLITLLGFAACGTLTAVIIWLVDKGVAAKGHRKRTNSYSRSRNHSGAPETNQTPVPGRSSLGTKH